MKEIRTILTEYDKIDFSKRKAAIATVVKVRGSSYRSPGARMLITDDGKWVGSISGGCLEGDALRKARHVMNTSVPVTVTYDTREESNQKLGIGLGCNGVIDVLIEPVTESDDTVINLFKCIFASEHSFVLATVVTGPITGEKFLVSDDGGEVVTFSDHTLRSLVSIDAMNAFNSRRSETKVYPVNGIEVEVFIEVIQPVISLIIFGGGFDARPVSNLAKTLGWNVTVTDECVAHIAPLFFPDADKLSLCDRKFVDRDFKINAQTACLLMSHNYDYDRDVLKKLITGDSTYIGILGPRKRFDKMWEEFRKDGLDISPEQLEKIHSPAGLDIGAETPDEIALSIISEIQGKFAQRSGGFLKYRTGPIHSRDKTTDQVFKQVYLADLKLRNTGDR